MQNAKIQENKKQNLKAKLQETIAEFERNNKTI